MTLKKTVLFIIALYISIAINAQGCFFAIDTVGCAPFSVKIQECVDDPTAQIRYIYGNSGQLSFDTTHTFSSPGYYDIEQWVELGGNLKKFPKPNYIRVVDTHPPTFNVTPCENNKAFIQITESTYDHYIVKYSDNTRDTLPPSGQTIKTYPITKEETISVEGYYDGADCIGNSSQKVTLIDELIKPTINQISIDSNYNQIELNTTLNVNLNYRVEIKTNGSSSFKIIDTLQNISNNFTYTITDLTKADFPSQVKIVCFDFCGNEIESDIIATQNLSVTATNNVNKLTWPPYNLISDLDKYIIYKNDVKIDSTTSTEYLDNEVVCSNQYCYRIETKLLNDNKSISPTICVLGLSTDIPPITTNFQSSVTANDLCLTWDNMGKDSYYTISRSINSTSDFTEWKDSEDTLICNILETENIDSIYFKINYTNSCDNETNPSDAPVTSPIILQITEKENLKYQLNWSTPLPASNSYHVIFINSIDGDTLSIIDTKNNYLDFDPTSLEAQELLIKVESVNETNFKTQSNEITLSLKNYIFIPTGYSTTKTKSGFYPVGNYISAYKVNIYNRWGEVIYQGETNTPWFGEHNGEGVPSGVYVYEMEIIDQSFNEINKKGTVTLVR